MSIFGFYGLHGLFFVLIGGYGADAERIADSENNDQR